MSNNEKAGVCYLSFVGIKDIIEDNVIAFGTKFMQFYTVIFDKGGMRIGFVKKFKK